MYLVPSNHVQDFVRRFTLIALLTQAILISHLVAQTPPATTTLSLSKLMTTNEPIVLRGARGEYDLTLPKSSRVAFHNIVVHIEYTSSVVLLDDRSALMLTVNDVIVAQVLLKHDQPENNFSVKVPEELLKTGYNKIGLVAIQHYTLKCEDPAAPELRTDVNSVNSTISFDEELKPVSQKLHDLDRIFDSKIMGSFRVNLVTGSASPSDNQLLEGAIVAQSIALRMAYNTLDLTESAQPIPGVDNVFVGSVDQLKGVVPSQLSSDSSFIQILTSSDPLHLNMAVSGASDSGVTMAAKALLQLNFPLPDAPEMSVSSLVPPAIDPLLEADTTHTFSELHIETTVMRGMKAGTFAIEFDLPPDLYANERSLVELGLHFAYGAEMRTDSVINIALNGELASAIPINDPNGSILQDYRLSIPLRSFKPGHNSITLQPEMMPLITDFCTAIQEENLWVTIYNDSTIIVPAASHYTSVPDLHLTTTCAFPLITTRPEDTFSLYIAKTDAGTVGSAWSLLAKLAQRSRRPLLPTTVSSQLTHASGSILAVGPVSDISPDLLNAAPVRLGADGALGTDGSRLGQIKGNIPSGNIPLLTSYSSPFDHNGVVLLYTGGSSEVLHDGLLQLLQPEYWEALKGDTAVWSDQPDSLVTASYSHPVLIGSVSLSTKLDYYFSKSPYLWAGIIAGVLFIFAFLTRRLLKKRKH